MSREDYATWHRRIAAGLEKMPEHVQRRMRPRAKQMRRDARRLAPRKRGKLAGSIRGTVEVDSSGQVVAHLWSAHPGAAVQDQGGTIHRGRHALTVPIGVVTVSPRSAVGTFLLRSRDGRRFIAQRAGGRSLRLLWRLMDSVRVPPTRYATVAYERAMAAVEADLQAAAADGVA